ncbi:hypothetical protein CBS9595_004064 [Malassezia furfur]|nr:hypothetical protein CBS9595_004064 [Malassezia furfur]
MAANKVTFARQDELPKLAVPGLEESCEKFLVSLAPLQTPEQHAQTKRVVERFLQNEGPQMQKELLAYAETQLSYIEEDEPDPARGSQLPRAANLTLASLSFIHDLRHEVLEPDSFRGSTSTTHAAPLDMYQYKRLFGLARVPTEHGCKQRLFPDSRHIVVMRKGQLYWFEVLDQEHRSLLTESELVTTLRGIVRDADGAGTEYPGQEPIGVLSTEKRRTWYELRAQLEEEPDNRRNLSMVDSALFVLCLDDDAPTDVTDLTNNMLCGSYRLRDGQQVGTCLNRWYDKLQIIVCKNGAAGVNFEHSSADGHTVLRFVGDIYTELILRFARSINPNTKSLFQAKISPFARSEARKHKRASSDVLSDVQARTTPRRLEWTLTPRLVRSVQHAEMRLSDLICQNECFVLEFKGYGKRFITNHGFSPDAFVQMAFQATYYTLYGRAAPTYEPAMTKAFLRGRTETIRTVQPHTMAFVEAWVNHEAPLQDRLQALRNACAGHTRISKEAAAGRGFDRYVAA